MGGRPCKPTALKLLHGEKNKDRIRVDEPKPRPITPEVPPTLDKYAKAEWKRMVPILERNRLLTEVDGNTLAAYCQLISLNIQTSKALKRCGYKMVAEKHTVDGAGNEFIEVKANPLVNQQLKIISQLVPYFREFGMTPVSRTKISTGGRMDPGEYEALLD